MLQTSRVGASPEKQAQACREMATQALFMAVMATIPAVREEQERRAECWLTLAAVAEIKLSF